MIVLKLGLVLLPIGIFYTLICWKAARKSELKLCLSLGLIGPLLILIPEKILIDLVPAASWISILFQSFFIVSLLEESCKFFLFTKIALTKVRLQKHSEGILYGLAIGIGFASAENIIHLLNPGMGTLAFRAVLGTMGHASLGILMGSQLFLFSRNSRKRSWFRQAYLIPFLYHGGYNTALGLNAYPTAMLILLICIAHSFSRSRLPS